MKPLSALEAGDWILYQWQESERIGEVSAQPLAEGELADTMMSTLKETYREEPG